MLHHLRIAPNPPSAIMDRNLGALDDRYHAAADVKAKYYQFGRKDPFNFNIYCWTYDAITLAPTKTSTANGARVYKSLGEVNAEYNTGGKNVPFSVNNPKIKIDRSVWTSGDVFSAASCIWCDPSNTIKLENEELGVNADKSIFDPCPNGWKIPETQCFKGFIGDSSGSATGSTRMNCQWGVENDTYGKNRGSGRTYFPLGYLNEKNNPNLQSIFFPSSGCITNDVLISSGAYFYLNKELSSDTGYGLYLMKDQILTVNDGLNIRLKSTANNIRCIKE